MPARVTALPAPPSRGDPANFPARADAFVLALVLFVAQVNALADEVNGNASTAATAAQSAVNAPGTAATSTTSLTIGTGVQNLAIQAGKAFVKGQFVVLARTSDPLTFMIGQITAYDAAGGALATNVTLTNGAGTYTDWTISISAPVLFAAATVAQLLAGASNVVAVTPAALLAAAAPVGLADAATITLDLGAAINFTLTLSGNRTLANPVNMRPGQSGIIVVKQDATGGRSLARGSYWKFAGGTVPLSTAANAIDVISYTVVDAGTVLATVTRLFS